MTFLKDIVFIEKGKRYNLLEEFQEGAIRVFQANDFRNEDKPLYTFDQNGVLANDNDILLVWDGSVGQMGFGRTGYIGSTMVKLNVKNQNKYSPLFIYRFLQTKSEYLRRKATGATIKHINRKSLEQLQIPEIHITDQLNITDLLTKAEDLIFQRKESIHLLDEFLKSTFLQMFYSNHDTENWKEIRFSDLAEKKKGSMRTGPFGSSLHHSEFTETGAVKVLGIDNVVKNKFEWKRSRCITLEKFQELKRYQVFPNDVLISIMATLGRTAVVPDNIPLCINSKHLAAITLNREIANPHFVSFTFHSHPEILRQLSNKVKGAIMNGLNLTIIQKLIFKLPPIELQTQFAELLEKTEGLKAQYHRSLIELEKLYGCLSQKAFKGEFSVKEEKQLMVAESLTNYRLITNDSLSIQQIEEKYFLKRKVLATYIINKSLEDEYFGDTKFEKILFLAEHWAIKRNFSQNYLKKAAGPYDNKFTKAFFKQIEESKWFRRNKYGAQFSFVPGINHTKSTTTYNLFLRKELERVDLVIKYFKKYEFEQPEIVATLFAVWNNRILLGQEITNELLINDFYNWDKQKKRYKDDRLSKALEWMRSKNFIPEGWGKLIL